MKRKKLSIPIKALFRCWKLITQSGRHFWRFKPDKDFLQKYPNHNINNPAILKQWQDAFTLKSKNPNPQDTVYRSTSNSKNRNRKKTIQEKITAGWDYFFSLQNKSDGSFPCDYGGPLFLLPGLALFSIITGYRFTKLEISLMVRYTLNHQNKDGGWGLHIEGESIMFTTVINYVSLRLWGQDQNLPSLKKARSWIFAGGGASQISTWGKSFLSVLGLYEWEGNHSWLPEAWILPKYIPFSPHNYWCHARMVHLPISYLYGIRYQAKLNLQQQKVIAQIKTEIYLENYQHIVWKNHRSSCYSKDNFFPLTRLFKFCFFFINLYEKNHFRFLRNIALRKIIKLIAEEDKKTNYINLGPINKIYNALVVYEEWQKDQNNQNKKKYFLKHCERIKDYLWLAEDGLKMKGYNGSQLWDCVFALRALFSGHSILRKRYKGKLNKLGNFIYTHRLDNGGWPFSTKEQGWTVSDCSAEGLYSMLLLKKNKEKNTPSLDENKLFQTIDFLLAFQNPDGGWPSYEKCRGPKWLEWLNSSMVFGNIMIDYSYVECTASVIQSLELFLDIYPNYKINDIQRAVQRGRIFILSQQKKDGSWYGSWGVCFTYGTFFAIKGLAGGINQYSRNLDKKIQKSLFIAGQFLVQKQDRQGGWGESSLSSSTKVYCQLPAQSIHTSWALLGLNQLQKINLFKNKYEHIIKKGTDFLLSQQKPDGDWPVQGIAGVFNHNCMISYTNFRNIFPLWALSEITSNQENTD